MSLKTVHLVFLLVVIIGADMIGAWALYHSQGPGDPLTWMGVVVLIGGLGLCWYAYTFVKGMEEANIS